MQRERTCNWMYCQRAFCVCQSCNRGHLYCSRECAQAARLVRQRAAGQRYQRTRRGRFKHAARQASYRARRRALQKVTHPSTQEPLNLGNLLPPAEDANPSLLPLPAARDHGKAPRKFGSERAPTAARASGQWSAEDVAGRDLGSPRGAGGARAVTAPVERLPGGDCICCQRSVRALRQAARERTPSQL